jgi:hypothetical protein
MGKPAPTNTYIHLNDVMSHIIMNLSRIFQTHTHTHTVLLPLTHSISPSADGCCNFSQNSRRLHGLDAAPAEELRHRPLQSASSKLKYVIK